MAEGHGRPESRAHRPEANVSPKAGTGLRLSLGKKCQGMLTAPESEEAGAVLS